VNGEEVETDASFGVYPRPLSRGDAGRWLPAGLGEKDEEIEDEIDEHDSHLLLFRPILLDRIWTQWVSLRSVDSG
jgi:hypothetical protein